MVLSIRNTIQFSYFQALIGVTGRFISFLIYGSLTGFGLGLIIAQSIWAFNILKIAGVVYLLYLGIQNFRNGMKLNLDSMNQGKKQSSFKLFKEEAIVAIANPKIILVFTALLPQFITSTENFRFEFMILTLIFCLTELLAAAIYLIFIMFFADKFQSQKGQNIMSKAIGSFLIGFAVIMATSTK